MALSPMLFQCIQIRVQWNTFQEQFNHRSVFVCLTMMFYLGMVRSLVRASLSTLDLHCVLRQSVLIQSKGVHQQYLMKDQCRRSHLFRNRLANPAPFSRMAVKVVVSCSAPSCANRPKNLSIHDFSVRTLQFVTIRTHRK